MKQPPPADPDAADLAPTRPRTLTGIVMMLGLCGFLLRTGYLLAGPGRAVAIALALAALAVAWTLWRGRDDGLRWTAAGLIDGAGRLVAGRAAIRKVERNPMALKPSNGFTLHLHAAEPGAWQPGLYWRVGRRVGVGGLTAPAMAKALADRIALDLAAEAEPVRGD